MEGNRGKELRLNLIVDSTVRVSVNMDDTINRSLGSTLTKGSPRCSVVGHKNSNIRSKGTRRSGLDSTQILVTDQFNVQILIL